MAVSAERNVMQKEAEKKLKYKSLCIELQLMWNMKCVNISVVTGATGIATKALEKHLEAIPGKYSVDSLQQTTVVRTSHITREVLQLKT